MSIEKDLLIRAKVLIECLDTSILQDQADIILSEIEVFLAQHEQWKPECCICKTNKNVEWVGGFQAYRCNSKECFPF